MRTFRVMLQVVAVLVLAGGVLALVLHPARAHGWHWIFSAGWTAALIFALRRTPTRWRPWAIVGLGALAFVSYFGVRARNDRDWEPEHSRAPLVEFHDDRATIRHFRAATYRTASDFDLAWIDHTVDLRAIRSVDYVVEPFARWRGLAHTFLTFGFDDGSHVAISVEARRERGEGYSTVKGLFRHYEMIYVIGAESDLIGLRANIRRDPVHLYPIQADPDAIRALFISMLQRANALAVHPQFYHSLDNTCTLAVLRHVNEVRQPKIRGGWRVLFPGYSDKIAWEIGLVDFHGTLEEARGRFRINERSAFDPALDDVGWSRKIRAAPKASRVEP
jgi:hypothetical protein